MTQLPEQREREQRAGNNLIFNLPESHQDKPGERVQHDLGAVRGLLEAINIDSKDKIEKCIRIGKKEQSKNRVKKVVMKDKTTKTKILRQARLLKETNNYADIFIGPDLTRMQRLENKELRKELLNRQQKGESEIFIQRGKIVQRRDKAICFKGRAKGEQPKK